MSARHRLRRAILLLPLFLTSLLACHESPTDSGELLPLRDVFRDAHAAVSPRRFEVINNAQRWQEVWREIHPADLLLAQPAPPAVDFSRESLVYAAYGEDINGCYGIDITEAQMQGAVIKVTVEEVQLTACSCTHALTYPVIAAAVPIPNAHAEFRTKTVTPCR
jgi:hypothetical protein